MKTIWKYELNFEEFTKIEMPKGAEILTVQTQYNKPCLWALVDPEVEKETRTLELIGTGMKVYQDDGYERKYIGTYQYQKGEFVGHVFEYIRIQ